MSSKQEPVRRLCKVCSKPLYPHCLKTCSLKCSGVLGAKAKIARHGPRSFVSALKDPENRQRGPSPLQMKLHSLLGPDWELEKRVYAGRNTSRGKRIFYRLDLAHPQAMLAVEVDGGHHRSHAQREKDAVRDAHLASLGWTVYRYTNAEVKASLSLLAKELEFLARCMISKLKGTRPSRSTATSCTTHAT